MTASSDYYDSAHRPPAMIEELREIIRFRELLGQLVARNILVRYKRSVLGLAWTMLNPLLMMTILTVVFSNIFRIATAHYPVYVLSGLILWNFFSQTTLTGMTELLWGSGLVQRIYIPRTVFVLAAVGTGIVNLLFALIPLALIMLLTGVPLTPALLFLPIPIVLTAMFATGTALVLSILAVSFADLVDIYQVALTAWLYLTPIIYPKEIVPPSLQGLFLLNPMYYFLELFRLPVYTAALPTIDMLLPASALALGMLALGWWVFTRNADGLAYRT
jgi:ABC-type polysaccharide/polyol phosphate export permease